MLEWFRITTYPYLVFQKCLYALAIPSTSMISLELYTLTPKCSVGFSTLGALRASTSDRCFGSGVSTLSLAERLLIVCHLAVQKSCDRGGSTPGKPLPPQKSSTVPSKTDLPILPPSVSIRCRNKVSVKHRISQNHDMRFFKRGSPGASPADNTTALSSPSAPHLQLMQHNSHISQQVVAMHSPRNEPLVHKHDSIKPLANSATSSPKTNDRQCSNSSWMPGYAKLQLVSET